MAAAEKKKGKAKKKKETVVLTSPVRLLAEEEMLADMARFVEQTFDRAGLSELADPVTDYFAAKGVKRVGDVHLPFLFQLIADMRGMSDAQREAHIGELRKAEGTAGRPRREQEELFWHNDKWAASAYVADLEMAVLRERPKINEGAYTCRRCQGKRTRLRTREGGRGDEMIPVMIECVGCGHTWNE